MKFVVVFKTPDALDVPTRSFGLEKAELTVGKSDVEGEFDEVVNYWQEYAKKFAEKFVKYGEYIRVEFDMEAGTANILRN